MAFHYIGTGCKCDVLAFEHCIAIKKKAITAGIRPGAASGSEAARLEREALEATTRCALAAGLPLRDGFYDIDARTWEFLEVHEDEPRAGGLCRCAARSEPHQHSGIGTCLPAPALPAARADLVAFVKSVLGEVERATAHNAGAAAIRILAPRDIYPGTPSIEVCYLLDGRDILGTYLVPIPPAVWAVISDPKRNPYDNAQAAFRPSDRVAAPAPVILEPAAAPAEHEATATGIGEHDA